MDWNKYNPRYKLPDDFKIRNRPRSKPGWWFRLREKLKKTLARKRRSVENNGRSGFETHSATSSGIDLLTGPRRLGLLWQTITPTLARKLESLATNPIFTPRLLAFLAVGVAITVLGWQGLKRFGPDTWPTPTPKLTEQAAEAGPDLPEQLPPPPLIPAGPYETSARYWAGLQQQIAEIRPGESLSQACDDLNLVGREQALFVKALSAVQDPRQIKPGARLVVFRDNQTLVKVEFWPPGASRPKILAISPGGDFKLIEPGSKAMAVLRAAQSLIEATLWDSAISAGLPAELVGALADMFAFEVDFLADIKSGDRFQVMYEQEYQDGRAQGQARIEMAILETGGRRLELYYHLGQDGKGGFYDPEGRSSIKDFFVTPLQYTRISSQYNLKRMHPILKRVRAHEGVDYAAPTGTPVVAVAGGTVSFAGWSGGYGKLATIQHSDTYSTMYAHLSGFAPNLRKGSKVSQGQVIGYVGSTGLSTGPHLDFRLKKNGQFVDPVVELGKQQAGKTLGKDERMAFKLSSRQKADKMIELLKARNPETN